MKIKQKILTHFYSILFIFDYSGSMFQSFDGKLKYLTLRDHILAIASVQSNNTPLTIQIFGSNPKNSCNDVITFKSNFKNLKNNISPLHPGNNGKTPLAKVIREISNKNEKMNKVFLFTDGADTCGEDPCQALINLDKKLKTKIQLDLIGYDLKEDKEKLSCFKLLSDKNSNQTLKNIDFHFIHLSEYNDFSHYLRNLSESFQKLNENIEKNLVHLRISDAPSTANFKITTYESINNKNTQLQFEKTWHGDYSIKLPLGQYQLSYISENGKIITIDLRSSQNRTIPFFELLKQKEQTLNIDLDSLEIELHPSSEVTRIFKEAKPLVVSQNGLISLNIGTWYIRIISPLWLKEAPYSSINLPINDQEINKLNIKRTTNLKEKNQSLHYKIFIKDILKDVLQWVDVPPISTPHIGIISSNKKSDFRILILPENKKIPLLKNDYFKLLSDQNPGQLSEK